MHCIGTSRVSRCKASTLQSYDDLRFIVIFCLMTPSGPAISCENALFVTSKSTRRFKPLPNAFGHSLTCPFCRQECLLMSETKGGADTVVESCK